jgi:SAM-dependent methyltransferase
MGFYARHVLPRLIGCACGSRPIERQRAKVVPQARGVVADFGFGSGTNLPHYDAAKVREIIAIEPERAMLDHRRAARRSDIPVREVVTGAEATGLVAHSVDTVVVTYALCTIPDPDAALAEARRILKPGGRLLFCEHGLAPDADVARRQRNIEPLWSRIAGGCRLTRDPTRFLEAAGFVCETVERMYLPGTPRFAGYSYWGAALPAA